MSLLLSSHSGLTVSLSTIDITGTKASATAYAGIEFQADGEEFRTPANGDIGYTVSLGNWLDSGASANVWIEWVRSGGTLADWNSEDSGEDTRLQMSSDRAWRIERATPGTATLIGEFKAYNAASGGEEIGASGTRTFTATQE